LLKFIKRLICRVVIQGRPYMRHDAMTPSHYTKLCDFSLQRHYPTITDHNPGSSGAP
jgi:hypothetical protein